MQLYIKLRPGCTLRDAALEVQQLNAAMADALTNGPLPCNPDSETVEGYLGDCNTPPNEYGIVTVRINAYESLELDLPALPQTFVIVTGYPRRGEEGSVLPGDIV